MGKSTLNTKLEKYINDPRNPIVNFNLGEEYEKIGHTGSALSYYLRAAELSYNDDPNFAYDCIIRTFIQIKKQTRRTGWEKEQIHTALSFQPKRPEAYYFLSLWYGERGNYKQCYSYACMGLEYINNSPNSIPEYPGETGLIFQKAFSSWYIGQRQESEDLWVKLYTHPNISSNLLQITINNLISFGLLSTTHDIIPYNKENTILQNINNIEKNYSQCLQDVFTLSVLKNKTNGSYLEIGAGDPFYGNNTALLSERGWKGVSLEIDEGYYQSWLSQRPNDIIIKQDATTADYLNLATQYLPPEIDYLQLDCDPPENTFKALCQIPFDKLKFKVITYEHDYYCDATRSYKEKSREILKSHGYELLISNVSPDEKSPYEDWWVNPDLVDMDAISYLRNNTDSITPIKSYLVR
jgi:tetratricopeptide (TPR) repeat protein